MTETAATPRISYPLGGATTPVSATPPRASGSIRRTSSIDTTRPEGAAGALHIEGHVRDLLTGSGGQAGAGAYAALTAIIAGDPERRTIEALNLTPEAASGQALIGVSMRAYRAALAQNFRDDEESQSLRYHLLDGLPLAVMLASVPVINAGLSGPRSGDGLPRADICAGWVHDGAMITAIRELGVLPLLDGPLAPALEVADDPDAWHPLPPLPPMSFRRRRRLDLIAGDVLRLDVHFRDSTRWPDGQETVVHEYSVRGAIEPGSLRFLELEATANVLPWIECPSAIFSAPRLVGTTVHDLRRRVRADFTGISTCTHLNDTLRSLEDIVALAPALTAPQATRG